MTRSPRRLTRSSAAVEAKLRDTRDVLEAAGPAAPAAEPTPEQVREQQGRALLEQIQAQTGRNVINVPLGDAA